MPRAALVLLALASSLQRGLGPGSVLLPLVGAAVLPGAAAFASTGTCGAVKEFYKGEDCCGKPGKQLSGDTPIWADGGTGVCACERMRNSLAGLPGAMFPENLCADLAHLKPVGWRHAPICEASDAGSNASLLRDGEAGNLNFPHGRLKVLATVGEINERTGAMLTGVPDGNGAYLLNNKTVRYIYQSESYGPLSRQESLPFFVNGPERVSLTGSHIHYIDFDRGKLAEFMKDGAPVNAYSMVVDSGEAIETIYNLKREKIGKRSRTGAASSSPHHSNVNLKGEYIVVKTPTKADWLMQSLCSAHLAIKHQWGSGLGVEDKLFITNEEWISYVDSATGLIGLPVHVLNLESKELYAISTFSLGGHEKVVNVNTGSTAFVGFVPSGYNGNFGGKGLPQVVASRNKQYNRTDGKPYVWPQDIVPTRLYVGKKRADKVGNLDNTSFLARNGFEYGALYGFATDCAAGTPGAEGRDTWHKSTAAAGDKVHGAFYRLRWTDAPGTVKDFVHDASWEFQDSPAGAPAGWCFWNAAGRDKPGAKTEHVSPDPRGGLRVLQGSTGGYFGIYDFSNLTGLLAAGSLPDSIPATYSCLQPEGDIQNQIELGGAGRYADGQNAKVMPDQGQNPGIGTFEDVDGMEWIAAANNEDFFVIHEDGGNVFGERKFLARVGTPMKYYFVAMSGGEKNSRELARVSAVEGVMKSPSAHEFSGATDISALLAKDASGNFRLAVGDATGAQRTLDAQIPINEKSIVVSLQAHSNWGGWTESFNPDAAGQILLYKPAVPAN